METISLPKKGILEFLKQAEKGKEEENLQQGMSEEDRR